MGCLQNLLLIVSVDLVSRPDQSPHPVVNEAVVSTYSVLFCARCCLVADRSPLALVGFNIADAGTAQYYGIIQQY